MKSPRPRPLSDHDAAIWHTIDVNIWMDEGRLDERPSIGTTFPLRFDSRERALAQGDFTLFTYSSAGDGSYSHNGGFFFATGAAGLALTAVTAAGRAAGNSRRRAQAASDATTTWRPADSGSLVVSSFGFYLIAQQGFHPWVFPAVTTAQMVGPGQLLLSGDSDRGPIQWILASTWAELVFTLWARAIHPQHPQLAQRDWIPPGWSERLQQSGHVLPAHPPSPQDRTS